MAGPKDCNGAASATAYYATALPLNLALGVRTFATNPVGMIWQDRDGSGAPPEPFAIAGDVTPIQ